MRRVGEGDSGGEEGGAPIIRAMGRAAVASRPSDLERTDEIVAWEILVFPGT
jgi:hypothetical protein